MTCPDCHGKGRTYEPDWTGNEVTIENCHTCQPQEPNQKTTNHNPNPAYQQ